MPGPDAPAAEIEEYAAHLEACTAHLGQYERDIAALRALFLGPAETRQSLTGRQESSCTEGPGLPSTADSMGGEINHARIGLMEDHGLVREGHYRLPHTGMHLNRYYQLGPLMEHRDRHRLLRSWANWVAQLVWSSGVEVLVSHGRAMHAVARHVIRETTRRGGTVGALRCRGDQGLDFKKGKKKLPGRRVAVLIDVLNSGELAREIVARTLQHRGLVVLMTCLVDCAAYSGPYRPLVRAWAEDPNARAVLPGPACAGCVASPEVDPIKVDIDRQQAVFEITRSEGRLALATPVYT